MLFYSFFKINNVRIWSLYFLQWDKYLSSILKNFVLSRFCYKTVDMMFCYSALDIMYIVYFSDMFLLFLDTFLDQSFI